MTAVAYVCSSEQFPQQCSPWAVIIPYFPHSVWQSLLTDGRILLQVWQLGIFYLYVSRSTVVLVHIWGHDLHAFR